MHTPPDARRMVTGLFLLFGLAWLSGCATPSTFVSRDPHAATRQRILSNAERLLGTPYVSGGESPDGVDCSGLVQYVYSQAGLRVPRTTVAQFQAGRPQRKVLPGDLLFFRTSDTAMVSHVGIYAGQGQMIHASSSDSRVRKVRLNQPYWQQHLVGGATFLGRGDTPVVEWRPVNNGYSG